MKNKERPQLSIEHLKNYLGTGLKFHYQGELNEVTEKPIEFEMTGINQNGWVDAKGVLRTVEDQYRIEDMFILCYRLSDLDKFIPELGFVPLNRFVNDDENLDSTIVIDLKDRVIKSISSFEVSAIMSNQKEHLISFFLYGSQRMTPFEFMQKIFQWHFWPFGDEYFEEGLVVDKMTYGK